MGGISPTTGIALGAGTEEVRRRRETATRERQVGLQEREFESQEQRQLSEGINNVLAMIENDLISLKSTVPDDESFLRLADPLFKKFKRLEAQGRQLGIPVALDTETLIAKVSATPSPGEAATLAGEVTGIETEARLTRLGEIPGAETEAILQKEGLITAPAGTQPPIVQLQLARDSALAAGRNADASQISSVIEGLTTPEPKEGTLVGSDGFVKATTSNAIRSQVNTLFNGIYDPVTGDFSALTKDDRQKSVQVAAEATALIESGDETSVAGAVRSAARELGIFFPGAPRTGALGTIESKAIAMELPRAGIEEAFQSAEAGLPTERPEAQQSDDEILALARENLRKGAPRNEIEERLRRFGIDPALLDERPKIPTVP